MVSEVNGPGASSITSASQSTAKPEQTSNQSSGGAKTGPVTDAVSMTDTARMMQVLDRAVAQVPSVDATRVESLREAIATGTLEIDPAKIADKLIEFESSHPDEGTQS